MPTNLRRWLKEVAELNGVADDALAIKVEESLGAGIDQVADRLQPRCGWRPLASISGTCPNCLRVHLHSAGGVCTYCRARLADTESVAPDREQLLRVARERRRRAPSGSTARS